MVVYVKNRTISWSVNGITPYKEVNKSVPSVPHLRALKYRYYVHVPDTTMCQTMYDYRWKGIMVGLGEVNEWRVDNPKTRRIHVSSFICFDGGFSYDNINHKTTEENDKSVKLDDVWNEVDDDEFNKAMARKQVVGREVTLADPIFQSKKRSVIAKSEKEGDNDSLSKSALDNNDLLPNQSMPPPAVSSKISSPLTNIFGANTDLLSITFQDLEDKNLPESPNIS